MKFTNGFWHLRDDVRAKYPSQVRDVIIEHNAAQVFVSDRPVNHRGDALNSTHMTVHLSSPMNDVIGVKLIHHSGGLDPKPEFAINVDKNVSPKITDGKEAVSIQSKNLTATISKHRYHLEFTNEESSVITKSAYKSAGMMSMLDGRHFMREALHVGVGEYVYGLGERFTAFVKNGQMVDTWNEDGGTSSEQTYKNVSFYITNRGYGVFVRHPEKVSFEIASERCSLTQFSVEGQILEYFVIYGPDPKDVLRKYTSLTGKPALPPAWSFGLWLTTSFLTSYDEKTVTKYIEGMAERDIPLHTFHFDCYWMKESTWCNFVWDPEQFPDPKGMLKRYKERGIKICVWINSYIAQKSHLFAEGKKHGYLLKRPDGSVFQTDQWQPGMGLVDFTNPKACEWWDEKLGELIDMGVDTFKTDFGERIPTEVMYYDGSDPMKMHNYYTFLYNKETFKSLQKRLGDKEACLFARSACAGSQQFPVHWGGDCESTFEALAETLRGGLSLNLSGFGFWSHDIGGFEGNPHPTIYKRWIAFGLLSSHSRLHGSHTPRVPWHFDDESSDVLRFFTNLKCQLMPYLFAHAIEAHEEGVPMLRAMLLEFPEDPTTDFLDKQFMHGSSLLVAPVMNYESEANYYLPAGRWTNFLTNETVEGPKWILKEKHDFSSIPLFARPNSIIAVGANKIKPDYNYEEGLELRIYALDDGAKATASIPKVDGTIVATVTAERKGDHVSIKVDGTSTEDYKITLVGEHLSNVDQGHDMRDSSLGTTFTLKKGTSSLTIDIMEMAEKFQPITGIYNHHDCFPYMDGNNPTLAAAYKAALFLPCPFSLFIMSVEQTLKNVAGTVANSLSSDTVTLSQTGDKMPKVGFGCWKVAPEQAASTIELAIRAGYRLIDGACDYGNEKEVGQGIRAAIAAKVVKREELFITTKLWNTYHAKEDFRPAFNRQLADLGLDYIDLYLIHFPCPIAMVPIEKAYPPEWTVPGASKIELHKHAPMHELWREMESLVESGLVKNIGVSNFNVQLLMDVWQYAKIKPQVLQVEIHPYLQQKRLIDFAKSVGLQITAYSSLGPASFAEFNMENASKVTPLLSHSTIASIAQAHNATPAQILLAWALNCGLCVIPKSMSEDRIKQNLESSKVLLSPKEMEEIAKMDLNMRFNDPDNYGMDLPIFA
ncbi:hypothetical protein BZG36_02124 [Bifiguratus adelaidae]|uniref:alpha-D-xyloside xylohydrolase n=1 Tax=Bifiguratus adelaidae TaxID=1938954 RepID=A0A261Y3I1_9FUNG|nr:hypothetical protein BZG36_02124 [Bifiguratus adelaidae]